MKTILGAGIISIFVASAALMFEQRSGPAETGHQSKWIALFNGKNLEGWTPKFAGFQPGINYKNTFRVENGLLKIVYDEYEQFNGRFGHLFYKHPYSHYKIRAEYRFVGKQVPGAPDWAWRNNGLKLHSQSPQSMGIDQPSPVSIEVQLLGGNGVDERPTANMCSMGTHVVMEGKLITQHCVNSKSKTYHGDQWVTVEAEIRGSEIIRHFVEGKEVLTYTKPQYDTTDANTRRLIGDRQNLLLEKGYIAIQAESHPTHFRKIEILPLAKNQGF